MAETAIVAQPIRHSNADTAKRLVSDAGLKFPRPWISAGSLKFTWPVGAEGFRISGSATLGLHHYIGDNVVDAHVIHFNEGRIEISGTLPGLTSPGKMTDLQDICMSRSKKILSLPGILAKEQYVVVENYEFNHTEDDRTSSIQYVISLIRVGLAGKAKASGGGQGSGDPSQGVSAAPVTPQRGATSQSPRAYTVTEGVDTLQAVADKVYGNVDQWPKLVDLNIKTLLNNNPNLFVNTYQLPYFRWPVGTKLAY